MAVAGFADIRPITDHEESKTAQIYNKINESKARAIAVRRREHLALLESDAEESDEATSIGEAR